MKSIISFSKYYSYAVALFLLIGIQTVADAQITVNNITGCDITVFVGQYDVTTIQPCDLCPINPPTAIFIADGDTQDIFGQDVCGETFGWIAWTIAGGGSFGVSINPGLFTTALCQTNSSGPLCNSFTPTQAFWTTTGTGPVELFIF